MFDALKQGIIRLYIFRIYTPLRCLIHNFRDVSREIRIALGLKDSHQTDCNKLEVQSIAWNKLCSSSGTILKEIKTVDGNVNLAELAILSALCRTFRPLSIMEIGTFDGRTTLNLAINTDARIFTLDLPCNTETVFETEGGDKKYLIKHSPNSRFLSPPNNSLPCVGKNYPTLR